MVKLCKLDSSSATLWVSHNDFVEVKPTKDKAHMAPMYISLVYISTRESGSDSCIVVVLRRYS